MILSTDAFERAYSYMKDTAADIECAVFETVVLGKSSEEAMSILEKYQCRDGGFGKLDYDLGYPNSCLRHTESACRHIFGLNPSYEHPVIKRLIPYLLRNFNYTIGQWNNILVPEVNEYPHAMWYTYSENIINKPKNREQLIEQYNPTTNAALAGILYKYKELVPEKVLHSVISIPIEKVYTSYTSLPYDMKSMLYFVQALDDNKLKDSLYSQLLNKADNSMNLDESKWKNDYTTGPCNIITSPTHPFYEKYKILVEQHLDFIIETQQLDGSWAPDWRWGETEYWEIVKKKLQGVLTLRNISVLKNFGSIECL